MRVREVWQAHDTRSILACTESDIEIVALFRRLWTSTSDESRLACRWNDNGDLAVDFSELITAMQDLACDFRELLLSQPQRVLRQLGVAADLSRGWQRGDSAPCMIRLQSMLPELSISSLRAATIGRLVSIRARVARVGPVKALVASASFVCSKCGSDDVTAFRQHFPDGSYRSPPACIDDHCRARSFGLQRQFAQIIDLQIIKVQQHSNESCNNSGRLPQNLDIELVGSSLVGSCTPGDDVLIVGIVKSLNADVAGGRHDRRALDRSIFFLYLEANSLCNLTRADVEKHRHNFIADTSFDHISRFQSIAGIPHLSSRLAGSLCPSIRGHLTAKFGLLLALFGGGDADYDDYRSLSPADSTTDGIGRTQAGCPHPTVKEAQTGNSPSPFQMCDLLGSEAPLHVSVRRNSHVLLVGDPGLGKSQMLRACAEVAPRSIYVGGNATTCTGLTASVSRDSRNASVLEVGSLVLADRGACCFGEDHQLLTNRGFFFLSEVISCADGDLQFAAYDRGSQTLYYVSPTRLVINQARKEKLIDLDGAGFYQCAALETSNLQHGRHGDIVGQQMTRIPEGCCGISIAATGDHDIFVAATSAIGSIDPPHLEFHKREAKRLAEARAIYAFHLIAHARGGLDSAAGSNAGLVRDAVLLVSGAGSELERLRTVSFYGRWLCTGSLLLSCWHLPIAIGVSVPVSIDNRYLLYDPFSECNIGVALSRRSAIVCMSKARRLCFCEHWRRLWVASNTKLQAAPEKSARVICHFGMRTSCTDGFGDSGPKRGDFKDERQGLKAELVVSKWTGISALHSGSHRLWASASCILRKVVLYRCLGTAGLCSKLIWATRQKYNRQSLAMWTSMLHTSAQRFWCEQDTVAFQRVHWSAQRSKLPKRNGTSTLRYIHGTTRTRSTLKSFYVAMKDQSNLAYAAGPLAETTSRRILEAGDYPLDCCKATLAICFCSARVLGGEILQLPAVVLATTAWSRESQRRGELLDSFRLACQARNSEIGAHSEALLSVKAGQWIPWWASMLCRSHSRAFLCPPFRADSPQEFQERRMQTRDAHFRDELVELLLHAGYSAQIGFDSSTALTSACDFPGRTQVVPQLSWKIRGVSGDSRLLVLPATSVRRAGWDIANVAYHGRTWCVTVPQGLIIVRRAYVDCRGIVTVASQPTVQGNCFPADDHQLLTNHGFLSLDDVLQCQDANLQFASYDPDTKLLKYEAAKHLVVKAEGMPEALVEISDHREQFLWTTATTSYGLSNAQIADGINRRELAEALKEAKEENREVDEYKFIEPYISSKPIQWSTVDQLPDDDFENQEDDVDDTACSDQSSKVSIVATTDHDIYAKLGRIHAGSRYQDTRTYISSTARFHKVKARALAGLDNSACFQLEVYAAEGADVQQDIETAQFINPLFHGLGLGSEEKVVTFLEIYGLFVGGGFLCKSAGRPYAIAFPHNTAKDITFLRERLEVCEVDDVYISYECATQDLTLIREPRWVRFYFGEYDLEYATSKQRALTPRWFKPKGDVPPAAMKVCNDVDGDDAGDHKKQRWRSFEVLDTINALSTYVDEESNEMPVAAVAWDVLREEGKTYPTALEPTSCAEAEMSFWRRRATTELPATVLTAVATNLDSLLRAALSKSLATQASVVKCIRSRFAGVVQKSLVEFFLIVIETAHLPYLRTDVETHAVAKVTVCTSGYAKKATQFKEVNEVMRELFGNKDYDRVRRLFSLNASAYKTYANYKEAKAIFQRKLESNMVAKPFPRIAFVGIALFLRNIIHESHPNKRVRYAAIKSAFGSDFEVRSVESYAFDAAVARETLIPTKTAMFVADNTAIKSKTMTGTELEHVNSGKWLVWWVFHLSKARARAILRGCRYADRREAADNLIWTASTKERDQLVILALHAGYSARLKCFHGRRSMDPCNNSRAVSCRNQDMWTVTYSEDGREASCRASASATPTLWKATGVRTTTSAGRVWCVTLPSSFVIVRRVKKVNGIVAYASVPSIQGNCAYDIAVSVT
mmetsp:Transcript_15248/g.49741  ORF Transcript_15248/g.49741 Transcript_15248/m.49741 type:complete len:1999 (+) Transcript_15248:234-6230(+)